MNRPSFAKFTIVSSRPVQPLCERVLEEDSQRKEEFAPEIEVRRNRRILRFSSIAMRKSSGG
jgi:hypothetical protein